MHVYIYLIISLNDKDSIAAFSGCLMNEFESISY